MIRASLLAPSLFVSALFATALLLAPVRARADVVVNGSNRTELLDCNQEAAAVNGNANRVVLHGACRSLHVTGAHNEVEVDLRPGGALTIVGADNHVLYTPIVPGPTTSLQGVDNSAAAGSFGAASAALAPPLPPAPPAPPVIGTPGRSAGTLLLRGNAAAATVDCGGRNVVIEGNGNRYTLRGGCRSVTVQGHGNTIRAALAPGSRIAIGGNGDTLHYTMTGPGPLPLISVAGTASAATSTDTASAGGATIGSPAQ